jgi:hypothetical protein
MVNIFLFVFFILALIVLGISRIAYPMDLGLFEAVVWAPAKLALSGHNPYNYATIEPYVMAPYGYFYYMIAGWNFVWGRSISIIAAGVIVYSIWSLTKNTVAVAFFLSTGPFLSMFAVQRPDLIALAAGTLGFTLLKKNVYLAAILCASTIFFKQTFLLMPIFALIWYVYEKQYGNALGFFLVSILLIAVTVSMLGEQYIWQHFILTSEIPMNYSRAWEILGNLLLNPAMIGIFFIKKKKYLIYFALAGLLAFITSLRTGSSINYYLETVFVISLLLSNHRILLSVLLICGTVQIGRNLRGEYLRWQGLSAYEKVINDAQGCRDGIAYYADMMPNPHFGDWIQYLDGRSSVLNNIFNEALNSKRYECIIWNKPIPGYKLVTDGPLQLYIRE